MGEYPPVMNDGNVTEHQRGDRIYPTDSLSPLCCFGGTHCVSIVSSGRKVFRPEDG